MQRLYNDNPYEKEFTAEIINVFEKDNEYHIELDRTNFYPKDGMQPWDDGFIDGSPVRNVYEMNGTVYHVVNVKPSRIHRVKCSIDWKKRYDYMQQHLGQHIISATLLQLFNANTLGIHLGKDSSYIDIDKVLDINNINEAEKLSNEIVSGNIGVEILYPTNAELKKILHRKLPPKKDEKIRIVKIGDTDISTCPGMHLNSTIEVQLIKIIKASRKKDGSRIEFLCGIRGVSDYFAKHRLLEKISKLLHCTGDNVLSIVENLTSEMNKAITETRNLKTEVADYEVKNMLNSSEKIGNISILKSIYDNFDLKYINLLASKLVTFPNVIVLFGVKTQDMTQLIFMCSKDLNVLSMNSLLKDAITLIDGKGGGSNFSAQGGGKNNNNLDSCIEYAYNKVKASIKLNFEDNI